MRRVAAALRAIGVVVGVAVRWSPLPLWSSLWWGRPGQLAALRRGRPSQLASLRYGLPLRRLCFSEGIELPRCSCRGPSPRWSDR